MNWTLKLPYTVKSIRISAEVVSTIPCDRNSISTRRQQLFSELSAHNWGWPRIQRTRYEALIRLCRVFKYSTALYDCVALALTLCQRQGAVLSPGNRSVQCARTELLTAVYLATSHESQRELAQFSSLHQYRFIHYLNYSCTTMKQNDYSWAIYLVRISNETYCFVF